MTAQLKLIDPASSSSTASPWRLDDQTRAIGRRGLAHARAALLRARDPFAETAPADGARSDAA